MIHACSCVAGGKGPTLGNMLVNQGKWQELLDLLNEEAHFADILCQNPQVWHGHAMKPKFEEKVSSRVIELIVARFGSDRLDVQVTAACDDILRKKLKLYMAPKKTKLGIESSAARSYTPYLSQKILTVRSKSKESVTAMYPRMYPRMCPRLYPQRVVRRTDTCTPTSSSSRGRM